MNDKEVERIFDAGWDYFEKRDKAKAFVLWKEAAERGYVKALHLVGFCYYWGIGTQKDKSLALECYQEAAKKGLSSVHLLFGRLLRTRYCWNRA